MNCKFAGKTTQELKEMFIASWNSDSEKGILGVIDIGLELSKRMTEAEFDAFSLTLPKFSAQKPVLTA